ncbi:PREDICTED: ABC transporter G family member 23-like isoform X2 [Vollenhovia emeryi]|uniref:ABC transporter G family member 23-like isoform X2 n=1 Tax=Vollenhovia emeryi TaxID=411798 RepID=UPI0005F4FB6E|nr:PREDICTED: ABC transporter G family member 23-like isoform X2 [Vollenhovia emeryi]
MAKQDAIVVRNANKRYGKGEQVLDGLNMTVSRGSIYGLLGPSGCGKTTILSCMVGICKLNSGEVLVLGETPGSKVCGIPGPRVGYMPQSVSLVGEFSVSDALYYFGRISGLSDEEIETKLNFLSELFQLPPANHLVKNISTGQQRRVSLAAALIHGPELLILDEPTVGLDPILRENIWAYLIKITQEQGTTVLITTHYIEETTDANKIGLMKSGKLLAELGPQELLEQCHCSLLEEAFLKLCEAQNNAVILNEAQGSSAINTGGQVLNQDQDIYEQTEANSDYKMVSKSQVPCSRRMKALLVKNGVQFSRNYAGILFALLIPIIQSNLLFLTIGQDTTNLKIAVVNDESGNCDYGNNLGNIWNDEITCHFGNLSCRFLHNFDDLIAKQMYYNNISEASREAQNRQFVGIIYFNQNFSEALQARIEDAKFAKDSDLRASQIQVSLDMSNMLIGTSIQRKLFIRVLETYKDIVRDCKYPSKLADLPIRFEDPIYGSTELTYADYVAPTYLIAFIFFMATTISTYLIITDRIQGVWNRSVVQGVKIKEILLSHILIQSTVIVIHTTMIVLMFFPIWGLECKGSMFIVIILIFINGFCGLMFGFVISVMCSNHVSACYISTGSLLTMTLINEFK